MRLIWTVKLYSTGGTKEPYRVKVEGNPSQRSDVPWIFAEGKGASAEVALARAADTMSDADKSELAAFVGL